MVQTEVSPERSLQGNSSLALTYVNTRGWHQLRTDDINASLPITTDAQGIAAGARPLGNGAGTIYQYQGSGVFRQNQLIVTARTRLGKRVNLFGYYVYNRAMSDTDEPDTLPSNPYNLCAEYGRAALDFRHRGLSAGPSRCFLAFRAHPLLFCSPPFISRVPEALIPRR